MDWKKLLKPQYLILSLYVIATALLLYIGSKLVDHFGDLLKSAEGIFSRLLIVLKPLALGFSFAYLLSPVVEFWEKRLKEILPERRSAGEKKGKGRGERRMPACRTPLNLPPRDPFRHIAFVPFGLRAHKQRAAC